MRATPEVLQQRADQLGRARHLQALAVQERAHAPLGGVELLPQRLVHRAGDYLALVGIDVTIPAGSTTGFVAVGILSDTRPEFAESGSVARYEGSVLVAKPTTLGELLDMTLSL